MGGKAIVDQETGSTRGSGAGLRVKHVLYPGKADMLVGISFWGARKMPIRRRMGSPDTTVGRRRPDDQGWKGYTCCGDAFY